MVDSTTLQKASELEVLDTNGKRVNFGTLFATQKTIVIFTRHFFCGNCQAYVQQLAAVPAEALKNAEVDIVVIGCGDWQAISHYAAQTGLDANKIYAEPTRKLYHALGMDIETLAGTPADQEKRSYLTAAGGLLKRSLVSIWVGPTSFRGYVGF
ncbi:hypothetical protein V5O48_002087 [Marasmius crinis-equi]|uniref:Thioredoxin domain-containing protein n=1 Tax=Marasmius crinis-equi TaxID=585013 RepID=A0ABR3FWL3_9AGAR